MLNMPYGYRHSITVKSPYFIDTMDLIISSVVNISSLGSYVRMSLWHIVNNTLDYNMVQSPSHFPHPTEHITAPTVTFI